MIKQYGYFQPCHAVLSRWWHAKLRVGDEVMECLEELSMYWPLESCLVLCCGGRTKSGVTSAKREALVTELSYGSGAVVLEQSARYAMRCVYGV